MFLEICCRSCLDIQISIHYLFTVVFKDHTSIPGLTQLGNQLGFSNLRGNAAPVLAPKLSVPDNLSSGRENATFVFLCRNSDINGVVSSIQQMEDRFNKDYGYPWILLNEEPFTEEFKRYQNFSAQISGTYEVYRRVSVLTDAPIHFGQIPKEHWFQPDWIDENKAREGRLRMMAQGIIYAGASLTSILFSAVA